MRSRTDERAYMSYLKGITPCMNIYSEEVKSNVIYDIALIRMSTHMHRLIM